MNIEMIWRAFIQWNILLEFDKLQDIASFALCHL
jgi:hypothetical protein